MSTPRAIVLFDPDAWQGSAGRLDAREARRRNLAHSSNVLPFRDGSVGPRPGLKAMAFTGIPTGALTMFGWAGTLGADVFLGVNDHVYTGDTTSPGAVTDCGSFAVTPTAQYAPAWVEGPASKTYITVRGDKCYSLDHSTTTLSAIAAGPGGNAIAIYGERLVVGGNATNTNRVWYSDAADYTTWPALNYFDVGDSSEVRGLYVQRNHLVIIKQSGEVWVLTGVPGSTSVLRRVSGVGAHPWWFYGRHATVLPTQELVAVPIGVPRPVVFDGANLIDRWRHLQMSDTTGDSAAEFCVCRGWYPDEVLVIDTAGRALYRTQGKWTQHTFGQSVGAWAASDGQGSIFLATPGGVGTAPTVWKWYVGQDRPATSTDTEAQPGDGSSTPLTASLYPAAWWDEQGREIQARAVLVDVEQIADASNAASVTVNAKTTMRRDANESSATSVTKTLTAGGSSQRRIQANVGEQGTGGGVEVRLDALVMAKVWRVLLEERADPTRSGR